ncbi:probable CCR4-associated factor 1 homolog 7 [Macadamia integrifolia]|uniref:probable CCR4-associated factor 1 homolog 7 n=1 Tax=Macadamia integrifolia TaxID=60698 RepID=UPI001C4FEEBC|nr:probable CCR4-associated factor 1 homolog 7 [Macadamia integrifolia]
MEPLIRNVWHSNFEGEMFSMESIIHNNNLISFDTEFPRFLPNTLRNASKTDRYEDIKFNVDSLKPIQFGLMFTDPYGNLPHSGGVWKFNFDDFDPAINLHMTASVELLLRNGIDLEKNKRGVDIKSFSAQFRNIIRYEGHRIQWLTFHGVYDITYFIKVLNANKLMSGTLQEFMTMVGSIFPWLYDLKFIAKFCHGLLGGALGLKRLAKILKVKRVGETHQMGFDRLIMSNVFSKMKKVYYEGYLYSISFRKKRWLVPPRPHFITIVSNGYYHGRPSFGTISSPLRWSHCHALVPTVHVLHCQWSMHHANVI